MSVTTSTTGDEIHQLQNAIDVLREEFKEEKKQQQFHSSWTRIITISTITYVTMAIYMYLLGVNQPYYSAVIPTTGFYLSTLSVSPLRRIWLKWCYTGSGHPTRYHETVLMEVANPV